MRAGQSSAGVHAGGQAHGLLLLNSNGLEVAITPTRLQLRAIGGVLDLYFFTGPTPLEVLRQLTSIVGRPVMPPYWSLGLMQSKCGALFCCPAQAQLLGANKTCFLASTCQVNSAQKLSDVCSCCASACRQLRALSCVRRDGYESVQYCQTVVQRYAEAQIPLETFVTDIQYMNGSQDFTLSEYYPLPAMQAFVAQLHAAGQRWVCVPQIT